MAKENDAPTEIETITLTMSRPVAEAVQAACEWYLRLHMGQFWDVADDLCLAKFHSDQKNGASATKTIKPVLLLPVPSGRKPAARSRKCGWRKPKATCTAPRTWNAP